MIKKSLNIKICDTHFDGEYLEKNYFTGLLNKKYDLTFTDQPDYVLFSVFGNEHLKYDRAIKIFFTMEDIDPDFNLCDYAIGFSDMHYADRYIRFPLAVMHYRLKDAVKKHLFTEMDLIEKDRFCDFVVSNGGG